MKLKKMGKLAVAVAAGAALVATLIKDNKEKERKNEDIIEEKQKTKKNGTKREYILWKFSAQVT